MSSFTPSTAAAHRPTQYGAPNTLSAPLAPAGTFAPGTKIQVGAVKVIIQKYFSEGGFAHVYLVKMPTPIDGSDIAVLKRVACPDKESLANMRTEVETMKKLKGHRPIVTYYDSHASQMNGGGYEVFLLMEFCNGGGLIDFMNTRLQNRLTEPEILKIFSDVAEGVACMHYLKPPLLHRDLKVENVLISVTGAERRFKLCDFGSTAPPRPAGTNAAECRLIEEDIQKHTTMQYRSPEMVDVYRKQPIDEKADIWALGVLLYKLCYYTTPFENQGQLAILNASFKYPALPAFSTKLKLLIATMLKEHPAARPTIYQVLSEACKMQGIETPIKDIYHNRTESESRKNHELPTPAARIASPPLGAMLDRSIERKPVLPDVVPMRRGRVPGNPEETTQPNNLAKGVKSDPFVALDSRTSPSLMEADEAASRFPSLDQFSLLHKAGNFDFASTSVKQKKDSPQILPQEAVDRLADDAFAHRSTSTKPLPDPSPRPLHGQFVSKAQRIIASTPSLQHTVSDPTGGTSPVPESRSYKPSMVSQGTMTSPHPSFDNLRARKAYNLSPIHRFPPSSDSVRPASRTGRETPSALLSPSLDVKHLSPTEPSVSVAKLPRPGHMRQVSSSRPSLEGGRPEIIPFNSNSRPSSSAGRSRPVSTYLESSVDYLREKEAATSSSRPGFLSRKSSSKSSSGDALNSETIKEKNIASNVDFLKRMESEEAERKKERRRSSDHHQHHLRLHHKKSSSEQPSAQSSTGSILSSRFGGAFKKFETNTSRPRTPSPSRALDRTDLTPIPGSATHIRNDDGSVLEEVDTENLPPEQRRELERRRLSIEEKRVADAAREYRQRLADHAAGGVAPRSGVGRATAIQERVRTYLDESQKISPVKVAEGYGRFTEPAVASSMSSESVPRNAQMATATKPSQLNYAKTRDTNQSPVPLKGQVPIRAATIAVRPTAVRPSAPTKPAHLGSVITGNNNLRPASRDNGSRRVEAHSDMTMQEKEDYIADFSKRFPSVGGLNQEFNQGPPSRSSIKTREV